MNFSELLARAIRRTEGRSIRSLAKRINVANRVAQRYVAGTLFPRDDTFLLICSVAGVSAVEGLLYLNMWRTKGRARAIYRQIFNTWSVTPDGEREIKLKMRPESEQVIA